MTPALSDLEGRVAIVTGAGQGLGRAYALEFAAAGAIAVIAEIDPASGQSVAAEITDKGGRALSIAVDVAEPTAVETMVATVLQTFGRIDALINNAALYMKNVAPERNLIRRPFEEIPLDEWDRVMRVNVTGAFLCARAVAPAMRKARYGRIVNVSSSTVLLGLGNYLHYVTSKAAIIGLTRGLARELGPHGITVNTLIPGLTPTEAPNPALSESALDRFRQLQCIPRTELPDDLVPAVLFLASEGARFITGQSINVDGGSAFV